MHIPKGVLILGKIHKSEHFLIGCQGELKVWGHGAPKRLRGGDVLVSPPGTRRVLYALSDAIFLNIHRAEPQPIEALEAELMEPDPECPFDAFNHLKPGFLEVRPCG